MKRVWREEGLKHVYEVSDDNELLTRNDCEFCWLNGDTEQIRDTTVKFLESLEILEILKKTL